MNEKINIWIIEDSKIFRRGMTRAIKNVNDIHCSHQFPAAEPALEQLKVGEEPNVILLDIDLPHMNGLEALQIIHEKYPEINVVILTVFDDSDKIFKAICFGARGYLLKTAPAHKVMEAIFLAADGGAPMSPEVASRVLNLFSEVIKGKRIPVNDYGLSTREKEVLELLGEGLVSKEIAWRLNVSPHTVINHQRNIYTKLHVSTNTGAVAKAIRENLI